MKRKKIIFLIGIVILVIVFFIAQKNNSEKYVEINGRMINIEIADTNKERQEGLMYRENLCENCGMLFVYDEEKRQSFWMKNTKIPLDIIFINSDLKIVDILHAQPCYEETCKTYSSENKSLYVLETNINMFNESIIGNKVKINY